MRGSSGAGEESPSSPPSVDRKERTVKAFRNVLVTTDFSPASKPAVSAAVDLASASGGRLWIVHVIPPIPRGAAPRLYREMGEFLRADAERRLRRLATAAGARGVRARPLLLQGPVHEAVRRVALERRVGLVVVGTHGRTGAARVFLGSVAEKLIATATRPVLAVKRRARRPIPRTVVFATDFSRASGPAWKIALDLARSVGARLRIVHAQVPLAEGQALRWAYAEAERELLADARKRLEALRRSAQRAGMRADILLLRGEPYREISRAARTARDPWVVVGTHGRTGLPRVLLGSVATRVLATAPCPVLTVRAKRS